jgi:hypothetical protein
MCEVPGSIPGWAHVFYSLDLCSSTTHDLMLTSLSPHLSLSLDLTQHTRWTATQENALHTYPFADNYEGADEHEREHGHEQGQEQGQDQDQVNHHAVARVYLQFLWLPEVRTEHHLIYCSNIGCL